MGWKNVKQHYGIKHIVRVENGRICIGSGYVHDIVVIEPNLTITRNGSIGRGEPFDGMVAAMEGDKEMLRRLIEQPDTFENSITVYTYNDSGDIIEKQCEKLGWPNVTHDGAVMYENTFSVDRDEIVLWAKESMAAWVKSMQRNIVETERKLAEQRGWLAGYEDALRKLQAA